MRFRYLRDQHHPGKTQRRGQAGRKMYRYSADYLVKGDTVWISILDEGGLPAYSDTDGKAILSAKAFLQTLAAEPSTVG